MLQSGDSIAALRVSDVRDRQPELKAKQLSSTTEIPEGRGGEIFVCLRDHIAAPEISSAPYAFQGRLTLLFGGVR
nr:MAG: hypothetical protein DIU57_16000 [Pseudomonadota bacterium]